MSDHVVWTEWDDLNVPATFKRLSPATTPIDSGDFSKVTFYVPWYMGGKPALELTKQMPNLKILQVKIHFIFHKQRFTTAPTHLVQ